MVLIIFNIAFINLIFITIVNCNDGPIAQLFEWKFTDVEKECQEFLGPYGYRAVQISPVTECAVLKNRPWYERYQPFSYDVESRSGNLQEFINMVRTCNKANVKVYVDVVLNHMSATLPPNTKGTANHTAVTSHKYYPEIPYTFNNFHTTCNIDNYQDPKQVRNCELVGLHDLDHSELYVRAKIVTFLNSLIEIGVAGFRIDAAKHMWPQQLNEIYSRLNNLSIEAGFQPGTKPFIYQEVIDYGGEGVKSTEYTSLGHVTEFKYGMELTRAMTGRNLLKWFKNFGPEWNMLASDRALAFIDNHDTQRSGEVLTYKTPRLYKMAVGFMLSWPYGVKRIMSGYDFKDHEDGPPHNKDMSIMDVTRNPDMTCNNGWICEHRWRQIYNMVGFSNVVEGTSVEHFWDNGYNQIAYCRGNKGFVAMNGDKYYLNQMLMTCLAPGIYCDIISGTKINNMCTGRTVIVQHNGTAQIYLSTHHEDGILAIHIESKLELFF